MPILSSNKGPLSAAQVRRLYAIAHAHGFDPEDVGELLEQFGVDDPYQLTRADYDALCDVAIPTLSPVEAPVRWTEEPAHIPGRATDPQTGEVYEDTTMDDGWVWPDEPVAA